MNPNLIKIEQLYVKYMSHEDQLGELASSLVPGEDVLTKVPDIVSKVEQLCDASDQFAVVKTWRTSEINPSSTAGKENMMDIVVVVDTAVSERDLAEVVLDHLEDQIEVEKFPQAVKTTINGYPIHIVPTKYATQGLIGVGDEDIDYFEEVVEFGEQFRNSSRLLQNWQNEEGLDPDRERLLPFEIELILSKVYRQEKPETQLEALVEFFDFLNSTRLSSQVNIYDASNNILLYHIFRLHNKQPLLYAAEDAYNALNSDNPKLSIIGI